jgi:class 3 adenylate cyclase/streptogramin lyase
MQRRTAGRSLGAVLFTDIVGSTVIAGEMGNTRWGELVSHHHRTLRREIRRFDGRENDTAGDGFFVTFERPVDAIRCAVAAAEAVRTLGIEIRAGVSFGQLELVEGKAGGLIVNTAARVMSVAGPGEVLVPASVKDIVAGTGISFGDHGVHRLKGIENETRLFIVTDVDGRPPAPPLAAEEAAERRRAILPTTRGRKGLVVGAIAAAAVAATAIWFFTRADDTERLGTATPARFLVELDPVTGAQRQQIGFERSGLPEQFRQSHALVAGQGAVWAEAPNSNPVMATLFRVDPRHGEFSDLVVSKGSISFSMVTAFDALWVATGSLIRVNPATYEPRPVLEIPFPTGGLGGSSLAADEDHLWIGTSGGTLLRVDPSGEMSGRRRVTDSIQVVAAGQGSVWVVNQFAGVVTRVDPASLESVAEFPLTGSIDSIAVTDGYVWTLDFETGILTRISVLTDRVVGQKSLPAGPTSLAVGLGSVWVSHRDGTVSRVDPATLEVTKLARVDGSVRVIAVDGARKSIWVDVTRSPG